jgi:hypothetical protein
VLLESTVGSFTDQPSSLLPINRRLFCRSRLRPPEDVLDDDPAPGRRDQGGVAVSVDRGHSVTRHLSLRGAEGEGIEGEGVYLGILE